MQCAHFSREFESNAFSSTDLAVRIVEFSFNRIVVRRHYEVLNYSTTQLGRAE